MFLYTFMRLLDGILTDFLQHVLYLYVFLIFFIFYPLSLSIWKYENLIFTSDCLSVLVFDSILLRLLTVVLKVIFEAVGLYWKCKLNWIRPKLNHRKTQIHTYTYHSCITHVKETASVFVFTYACTHIIWQSASPKK